MTEEIHHKEHEHWIHYTIDDEPESTLEKILTPTKIMSDAGIDPQTNYLEQLVHGHPPISYKDKPNEEIEMKNGIEVPADFNVTCPTGPHILPGLIPLNPSGAGNDRAATSPFGDEWQYLSRPFRDEQQGWNRTKRDVKAYLHHVRQILDAL